MAGKGEIVAGFRLVAPFMVEGRMEAQTEVEGEQEEDMEVHLNHGEHVRVFMPQIPFL